MISLPLSKVLIILRQLGSHCPHGGSVWGDYDLLRGGRPTPKKYQRETELIIKDEEVVGEERVTELSRTKGSVGAGLDHPLSGQKVTSSMHDDSKMYKKNWM